MAAQYGHDAMTSRPTASEIQAVVNSNKTTIDRDEVRVILTRLAEADGGIGVSMADRGADPTGVADCAPLLTALLAEGRRIIFFGPGRYRFATKVNIPAGTALIGAGWQDCEIIAEGNWWIECFRSHAADVTTDWCRCTVAGFLVTMAKGGVKFWGHEVRISEMRFAGGGAHMNMADATTWVVDPDAWCIEGVAANEFYIGRISAGYGGNNAVNTLFANGIRLTALDIDGTADLANYLSPPAAGHNQRGVNYGDGLVEEVSMKGRAKAWRGLQISHSSTSTGVQNMIQVHRCQFQAADVPSSVQSNAAMAVNVSGGLYAWKDSIGVDLLRVRRCAFIAVNTETSEIAWRLRGSYQLNEALEPIATITTDRNTFIACPTMNSLVNYQDNNAEITGAVKDNPVQGSQSFGPLQPTGVTTNVGEGANAIKAGVLDTYLPGQLWFNQTQTGLPHAWMRFSPSQDFLLGVVGSPDPGNTLEDSHPRNDAPRRAIGFRTAFNNEAQIFLPRAAAQGRNARLKLGNGEDDAAAGPLEAILLADPVRMPTRTNPPTLTGSLSRGTVMFADSNVALGGGSVTRWAGPGLYVYLDRLSNGDSDPFQGAWFPLGERPGYLDAHLGRSATAYTVDEEWFGRHSQHGHGSNAATITVPPDLITAKGVASNKVPRSAREFEVSRIGNAPVTLVAGSNVTMYHPEVSSGQLVIPQWCVARCLYVRAGDNDFRLFVHMQPTPQTIRRRSISIGSGGVTTTDTNKYAYTVPADMQNGMLVTGFADPGEVTLTFSGAVIAPATGPDVVSVYVRNGSTGDVKIGVTAGTTAASGALLDVEPGETVHYLVERTGSSSWVLTNVTQSQPAESAGPVAAASVTLDDTGMEITAADVQTGIAELDAKVDALADAVEGTDDVVVVEITPDEGDYEVEAEHASGALVRRAVLLDNSAAATVSFGSDFFPTVAGTAREYNLLLEGAGEVELDLGVSDELITPTVAADIDMVTYDGTDPGNQAFSFDLGGVGFRPAGTGQVAILTIAVTHRTTDPVELVINWPDLPAIDEYNDPIPLTPIQVSSNGAHEASPDGLGVEGHGGVWNDEPTYRSFVVILGDADAASNFVVSVASVGDVYAASASLVILNNWQRTFPAILEGEALFQGHPAGDAEVRRNGGAGPTDLPNGIRVTHYHGLNLADTPSVPPILIDDTGVDPESDTPIAEAYASADSDVWWRRGVAAVFVMFETEDLVGSVQEGGTGATDEMREFYLDTFVRQVPETDIDYRGPGPVFPAAGNPRALKLLARPGKKLSAVNL